MVIPKITHMVMVSKIQNSHPRAEYINTNITCTKYNLNLMSTMKGVEIFLESSTIHGLNYISTTRKYSRIFWILAVMSGFLGAGFLIKKSFDSWSESPVKTTIETIPISELKFPKVTVCPPRNTLTDLNYDLMMIENFTLTEKNRDEIFKYALEVFNEDSFFHAYYNWTKLHEVDRFYNWYHGYTEILGSFWGRYGLEIKVNTWANSGVVTSQNYGQKMEPNLVERKLYFQVFVFSPKSATLNKNVTLHLKVDKVTMTNLAFGNKDKVYMEGFEGQLDDDKTTFYANFTPPQKAPNKSRRISLTRNLRSEEVDKQRLDQMPGFRVSWWYTGTEEVTPEDTFTYKNIEYNRHFTR